MIMGMKGIWAVSVIASILILGTLGLSQDVWAPPSASFTLLPDLPGGDDFSFGIGISDDGSVVVVNSHSDKGFQGGKWTATGGLVPIPALTGGEFPESFPTAVSADGTVIVGGSSSENGASEAFLWTETGGVKGLGDLTGGDFSSNALGVSADGSVIVGGANSEIGFEAFMWTEPGGIVGLGGGLEGGDEFWFAHSICFIPNKGCLTASAITTTNNY